MNELKNYSDRRAKPSALICMCLCGLVLNLAGSALARALKLPLFLDCSGTLLAASIGGSLPGIFVGLLSNLINGFSDPSSIYYAALNVLIAVFTTYSAKKGFLKRFPDIIITILVLALIGGLLGSLFTWFLYGFANVGVSAEFARSIKEAMDISPFKAQVLADFLIDLADKTVVVLFVAFVLRLIPDKIKNNLHFVGWQQKPLSVEAKNAVDNTKSRLVSLRTKILALMIVASVSIAFVSTAISFILYSRISTIEHENLGNTVANLAGDLIDPEKVDEYIEKGEALPEYNKIKEMLYSIRESSDDIEYLYVYKIDKEGCHVVFDLDTEDMKGDAPGTVKQFEEAFKPYLPAILNGEEIPTIVSNDTYGWLLTIYHPIYNKSGECVCYTCTDISMNKVKTGLYAFIAKQISLFLGFFILIMVIGLWLAEYNVILPLNTMALAASAFAYNSEEAREGSIEKIREIDIRTGDEIENLYDAFSKTSEDSVKYVADLQKKNDTIYQMQNGLIIVLADIVESRDKCTGDHIRKTAAYTRIIMQRLRELGYYEDMLTDRFMFDVVSSAPLHDIGKIHIPDTILNKPGRLTDEEFDIMKTHTTEGRDIIEKAIEIVPESGYLEEAKNLAAFHHEKWNGKGYPVGLKGEEIPLSARIMAVADVFDALVSERSYKKPFTFEKAMEIIKEGSGEHFDPKIVEAFVAAEDEVRQVAEDQAMGLLGV